MMEKLSSFLMRAIWSKFFHLIKIEDNKYMVIKKSELKYFRDIEGG